MSDCPYRVFILQPVLPKMVAEFECPGCGEPMGTHAIERRDSVAPSMAYVVNPETVTRYP